MSSTTFRLKRRGPYGPLFVTSDYVFPDAETERWTADTRELAVHLVRICRNEQLSSLSAIQLGVPIRAFVLNVPGDHVRVCINPEVTITDFDEEQYEERCGSYYSKDAVRYRHRHLILSANSLEGSPFFLDTADTIFSESVSQQLSCRIQHEMEHLNGAEVRTEPSQQMELS